MRKRYFFYFTTSLFLLSILSSCVSNKDLLYFKNVTRDSIAVIKNNAEDVLINKNDILQINITSLDEQVTRIFNSNNVVVSASSTANGPAAGMNGFLVDESGNVTIPLLGPVKAQGLTRAQLAAKIYQTILDKKLAVDPVVSVKVVSYKITILGEVAKPGVIPIATQHITIPEALGMAGDLTPYAKRNSLLLVREINGKRIFKRFSLADSKLFDDEFYNLQDHDIIIVDPTNAKAAASDRVTQLLPIVISSLSLIAVIVTQLVRK